VHTEYFIDITIYKKYVIKKAWKKNASIKPQML